jgi:heme/copper-type cytochrome/quinol oxidase subunit 3
LASTVGAFIMALAVLVFLLNLALSVRGGELAGDNPWDAWTLEWATKSPPVPHNFERVPPVRGRRPLWDLAHADPNEHPAPPDEQPVPDKSLVGVTAFIVSEATFFVVLILSYVYFNVSPRASHAALDVTTTGLFSVALVASSATLYFAERSLNSGRERAFRAWLFATIALGGTFLYGQASEYHRLLGRGLAIDSSLFASTFYTLTGFHGLHVTVGLVALGVLAGLASRHALRGRAARALRAVGLYWHFVDVVWLMVFVVVYVRSLL